mmetsp:Transcript_27768/g.31185  ORF Transcript_27768/g.31185 Transcript_27768/m.31185 type:complete len:122 (-) Transcript_27768:678-1043(-)
MKQPVPKRRRDDNSTDNKPPVPATPHLHQWGSHQSVATVCKNDGGNCRYDGCPGLLRNNKRRRSYPTRYQCLQCSIAKGYPVYLCNTTKKGADGTYFAVLCHMKYHEQQFGIDSASDGDSP